MLYGDLSYYSLVRRRGLTIERGLDGNDFAEDKITVKSTVRCGGALTFPEALTVVKIGS
jgi:HK97 family phage major capsid protein